MRCLVTGAYGFIGREVVTALIRQGVTVVGAGRDLDFSRRILPDIDWIACDFNRDTDVSQWRERLGGIDAVVNCVGILQGTAKDKAERIHGITERTKKPGLPSGRPGLVSRRTFTA